MKKILKLSFIAIVLGVILAIGIKDISFANNDLTNEELIANLMAENEDNPESIKYLVTDTFISRVAPETTVEDFKENFSEGEVVKVYEDETCLHEVVDGYVFSGMYAKYELNGRVFKISVLGDINSEDKGENNISGDGILNQIELTRIIREHVKTEGWEIEEREEKESANTTCDENVDIEDVNSVIDYIVWDRLEIPEVDKIESPKVEVIEGDEGLDGKYTNGAKVKITQVNDAEKTLKTVYKITKIINGEIQAGEYKEINGTEEVIDLQEDGIYKITAYTYGTKENKSKGASKLAQLLRNYTIIFQNEDGTELSKKEDYHFGDVVEEPQDVPTKTADASYTYTFAGWDKDVRNVDGNEIYTATYTENPIEYNIIYELNGGTNSENNPDKYTVESNIALEDAIKTGYTFEGWYETENFEGDRTETIQNRTGDITLYAKFTANAANYIVEHYKENLDGEYVIDENETDTIQSFVGRNVTAEVKTFTGFTYDENNENNVKTGQLPPEGTLTLKLYYKRNSYKLTLQKNENIEKVILDGVNEGEEVYDFYKYEQVVNINATLKEQDGYRYTWDKWTYNGQAIAQANQNQDIRIGAQDVTLVANGNKELITYNINYVLNNGTNDTENPTTYNVESNITLKDATRDEYTFAGWYEKKDNSEEYKDEPTVGIRGRTGDITLYAKWIKNEYKVIVNHYEEGTTIPVAQEEVFKGNLGESFTVKDLIPTLDEVGHIIETDGREYLNPDKYTCVSEEQTITFAEEDQYVTYYYRVATFEITGEAGLGGSISSIDETVRYGENSTKDIIITPDIGNRVKEIKVNGEVVTDYTVTTEYQNEQRIRIVNLPKFEGVTEDKHVLATFEVIQNVAKIIEAPEGYENLVGTEYEYLEEAINACGTKDKGKFVIQIINNVINEINTIENKDITIDLNGYEVKGSDSQNATLTVESGELKVVDSMQTGKVINTQDGAIKVEPGGTFTIGEDDGTISYNSPIIEGSTTGVYNEGIFNFYDGIIRGQTAIDGQTTDTPNLFDPSVETVGEIKEATLKKVKGIEAVIGKTRYTTLEQAIFAANNIKGTPADEIEIDVVTDITKDQKVIVDETKNIILDLNGFIITSTANDYIFENSGKMQIIDSTAYEGEKTENKKGITSQTVDSELLDCTIDTGIVLAGNYRIETKIRPNAHYTANNIWRTGDNKFLSYISSDGSALYFRTNNSEVTASKNLTNGKIYNLVEEYKDGVETVKINGEECATKENVASGTATSTLRLFEDNYHRAASELTVYEFKVYMEDELVADLEPVKAGDTINGNVAEKNGFYDKVTGTFKYAEDLQYKEETIVEGEIEGTGKISSSTGNVILNKESGILKVKNASLESTASNCAAIVTEGTSNVTLEGASKLSGTKGIVKNDEANVTINGGIIATGGNGIEANGSGKVTINNVIINTTGGSAVRLLNNSTTELSVKSGVLIGISYVIYSEGTGDITVDDGTLMAEYGIGCEKVTNIVMNDGRIIVRGYYGKWNNWGYGIFNSGNTTVNGGVVYHRGGSSYTFENRGAGDFIINGGILNSAGYSGVLNCSSGNVIINGGKIVHTSGAAIGNNSSGNITINDGYVKGTGSSSIGVYETSNSTGQITILKQQVSETGSSANAVNNSGKGNIIIGNKDGSVVDDDIVLSAENNIGVYDTNEIGNIYFYDGTVIGKQNLGAVFGNLEEIEENTFLDLTIEDGKEIAKLKQGEYVAQVGENKYTSLDDAIRACTGESTVEILKDFAIIDEQKTVVNSNQNITLDLKGHTITTVCEESAITNKGTLKLKDSSDGQTGTIITRSNEIVNNVEVEENDVTIKGILNIESGNYTTTKSGNNIIINSGELSMTGGKIYTTSSNVKCIDNENNGNVYYTNGTIEASSRDCMGIYHNSIKNVVVSGGTITSYTGIYNNNLGNITISNVTITSNSSVYNNSTGEGSTNEEPKGEIIINSGTFAGHIYNYNNATIKINGGSISSNIINNKAGNIYITGGTILSGVNNYSNGNIYVSGGSITGGTGIYNQSSGTVEVTGGTIRGTSRWDPAIQNNNVNGTVIIGTKDGIVSTESPKIIGNRYGVRNNGIFKFYDGIIEGNDSESIVGIVSEIEEEYDIQKYKTGESEEFIVPEGKEISILKQNMVAQLQSTGAQYTSLKKAFEEAANIDTISLIDNTTITANIEPAIVAAEKNLKLDIAGYTITASNENTILNNGKLEIVDTSEGTTGSFVNTLNNNIKNNEGAKLTISSGNITNTSSASNNARKYAILNLGEMYVTDGNIKTTNRYVECIKNGGNGLLHIEGGYIYASSDSVWAIYNLENGKLEITGGTVECYGSWAIYNDSVVEAEIKGGTITGANGIYNNNSGKVTIDGATLNTRGTSVDNRSSGELYIENGTITSTSGTTINNNSNGIVTVKNGTITARYDGIYNNSNGNISVQGGTIESQSTSTSDAGIRNYSTGSVNITGGTVKGKTYGIYNNTGNVVIGTKDNDVNSNIQIISTEQNGVFSGGAGIVKIYDGTIKGKNNAIYGVIGEIEDDSNIHLETEDDVETATLQRNGFIAKVDEEQFRSLKEAVDSCGENDKTVILLDNFTLTEEEQVTIGENQKITLNLNGKNIKTFNYNPSILNKGDLTITDTEDVVGKIASKAYGPIENTNKLKISGGEFVQNLSGWNYNDKNIIKNTGELIIEGGIIKSALSYVRGIYNLNAGKITINGGNINISNSTGIYSESTNEIIVYDGEFNCSTCISAGNITVNGGTISATRTGIYKRLSGTVTINGGVVSGNDYAIYNYDTGKVILNSGGKIVSTNGTGIDAGGPIDINGGEIIAKRGIYNGGGNTLKIIGGTITATEKAIENWRSPVIILGGEIVSTNTSNQPAIKNSYYGTITLGDNEETVSTTTPVITGGNYGIQSDDNCTINFYDGVITGKTKAIEGAVNDVPEEYEVKYEDSNKKATLTRKAQVENVISVNGQYFTSLSSAIDTINGMNSKTGTIEINGEINLGAQVQIPQGVNITLEMRGHSITYNGADAAIVNNGTLTIVDYVDTSEGDETDISIIQNNTGNAIENNETLTLGINDGVQNVNSPVIKGGITGQGTLTIYDGKVE